MTTVFRTRRVISRRRPNAPPCVDSQSRARRARVLVMTHQRGKVTLSVCRDKVVWHFSEAALFVPTKTCGVAKMTAAIELVVSRVLQCQ